MAAAALLAWGRPPWVGLAIAAGLALVHAASLDRTLRSRVLPLVLLLGALAAAAMAAEFGLTA
jgi:hypothetical protein